MSEYQLQTSEDIMPNVDLVIVHGPALIAIEHALFDDASAEVSRKRVRFGIRLVYSSAESLTGFQPSESDYSGAPQILLDLIVLSVHRKTSADPEGEWVLWVKDPENGVKFVFVYSAHRRKGKGERVIRHPSFYA